MKKEIKELRVKIDGLYQLTKELKPIHLQDHWLYSLTNNEDPVQDYNSIEIEDAAKSLLLAKAWLGKLLFELGDKTPYTSGKKEVKDIEPTADTHWQKDWDDLYDVNGSKVVNLTHIQKVDWIRSEIQSIIDELDSRAFLSRNKNNAHDHLCEAKMWLGFEFKRIKDEN